MPRFQKGQSGNPGGRPAQLRELRALARAHAPEALATLADVMRDSSASPSARVAAACALLDRGYGRPPQALELERADSTERSVYALSDAELVAILQQAGHLPRSLPGPEGGTQDAP